MFIVGELLGTPIVHEYFQSVKLKMNFFNDNNNLAREKLIDVGEK